MFALSRKLFVERLLLVHFVWEVCWITRAARCYRLHPTFVPGMQGTATQTDRGGMNDTERKGKEERERETDRQTDRQTDRDRQTETDRQTERTGERGANRQAGRQK